MPFKDLVRKIIGRAYSPTPKLSRINPEDIEECLEVCGKALSHVMAHDSVKSFVGKVADWGISVKAEYDGRIVGCYVLNTKPVTSQNHCAKENLDGYRGLNGVQGVALAVLPEYRDLGIGKLLRQYPIRKGYDYIWGLHMKGLHNIDNWVKFGRRIVCETGGMFTTLMDISERAKKASRNPVKNLRESEFGDFHSFQKAGHTCGPTCVQMVADFLKADYRDIDHIIDLCGCNTKTGTVDSGIRNALDSLGIPNERNPHRTDEESAMDYLDALLENGDMFIMRTLTRGVKHWIIVYAKTNQRYLVADPWLGKISYGRDQILEIWKPRDFDGFLVKR